LQITYRGKGIEEGRKTISIVTEGAQKGKAGKMDLSEKKESIPSHIRENQKKSIQGKTLPCKTRGG